MKTGQRQELFSLFIAKLILKAYELNYKIRCGDFRAFPEDKRHKTDSLHYIKCAADLNLFNSAGDFLLKTEDHKALGEYWESLHTHCRWGGRYGDGNHYEFLDKPR